MSYPQASPTRERAAKPRGRIAERIGRQILDAVSTEIPQAWLCGPALVFSPHPDDESLACGGTILRKTEAGVKVKVVLLTDGSASHDLLPMERLKELRREELERAGRILGVSGCYYLDIQDRKLNEQIPYAVDRVLEILRSEQPADVYLPFSREPDRQAFDHVVANRIVMQALALYRRNITIWEYPVWFWLHWPWVGMMQSGWPIGTRHVAWNSAADLFGLRTYWNFRGYVRIGEVLARKQAALAQHRSQMEQLVADPRWTTLGQVCAGEFLNCFYQDREYFRVYPFHSA